MKKSLLFLSMFFVQEILFAQGGVTMADEMRRSGKIYVVVAVLLVIFLGIIIYLVRLDRKLSRLEKNTNS
ncbi:MAG: CcmD family protein [Flavisolibacter sp.]